jgi:hypothetical protein
MLALPLASLDRMALRRDLDNIGKLVGDESHNAQSYLRVFA